MDEVELWEIESYGRLLAEELYKRFEEVAPGFDWACVWVNEHLPEGVITIYATFPLAPITFQHWVSVDLLDDVGMEEFIKVTVNSFAISLGKKLVKGEPA